MDYDYVIAELSSRHFPNLSDKQRIRLNRLFTARYGWDGKSSSALSAMSWATFTRLIEGVPSSCLANASFTLSPTGDLEMQLGDASDSALIFENNTIRLLTKEGEMPSISVVAARRYVVAIGEQP